MLRGRSDCSRILLALLLAVGWQLGDGRLGTATQLTKSTFEAFIKKNDAVLVDFCDDAHRNSYELEAAARMARDFGCTVPFAKVDADKEKELAAQFVPNGKYPQLLWFRNGAPTQYHRTLRNTKQIVDFVLALNRDPITEVASAEETTSYNRVLFAEIPKKSDMYKALEVVAQRHMDTVGMLYMESSLNRIRWLSNDTDLVTSETQQMVHATYDGDADVEVLDRWVRGQLVKSEPIPERQDGDSLIVVGLNFEESVYRADKDVFLNVYAPWCGFSRKFLPTWENFARLVANNQHLVVAKMDGDANQSPDPQEFRWNAYPSVFFLKAGSRTPHLFTGNRTISNLIKFANEHGSQPISLTDDEYETIKEDL
eukprot:TRINITY_DN28229_c0_g1_i1.p1 TRINITY_DN28229_c0_g1~~TRINITY_DN28229_c0_g1_i1.p1  ORF type:complete len:369 (+),score=78.56 TRINITY_DN28229_c0_g1_i1:134-1240(+)